MVGVCWAIDDFTFKHLLIFELEIFIDFEFYSKQK